MGPYRDVQREDIVEALEEMSAACLQNGVVPVVCFAAGNGTGGDRTGYMIVSPHMHLSPDAFRAAMAQMVEDVIGERLLPSQRENLN